MFEQHAKMDIKERPRCAHARNGVDNIRLQAARMYKLSRCETFEAELPHPCLGDPCTEHRQFWGTLQLNANGNQEGRERPKDAPKDAPKGLKSNIG